MVDHIYGRINILNSVRRPNMFVNELVLYLDYFKNESGKCFETATKQQARYLQKFQDNLLAGIEYYRELIVEMKGEAVSALGEMKEELNALEKALLDTPSPALASIQKL